MYLIVWDDASISHLPDNYANDTIIQALHEDNATVLKIENGLAMRWGPDDGTWRAPAEFKDSAFYLDYMDNEVEDDEDDEDDE